VPSASMATLARSGGEEFVVLSEDLVGPADAIALAERVADVASQPVDIQGASIRVSASLGVVYADRPHETPTQLIVRADEAMYRAKQLGRGRIDRPGESSRS